MAVVKDRDGKSMCGDSRNGAFDGRETLSEEPDITMLLDHHHPRREGSSTPLWCHVQFQMSTETADESPQGTNGFKSRGTNWGRLDTDAMGEHVSTASF